MDSERDSVTSNVIYLGVRLDWILPCMDFNEKQLLLNVFFMSQFNYSQLVCMCHNRTKINKMNSLHERRLCLIYNEDPLLRNYEKGIVLPLFIIRALIES